MDPHYPLVNDRGAHIAFADCADGARWHWVGAFNGTRKTGELSAIYYALA